MKTSTCFDTNTYETLSTLIKEKGTMTMLHKRLVADVSKEAKEITVGNSILTFVEYDETSRIIVIDIEHKIPTYFCKIKDDVLSFSAYESRIDSEQDIQNRKDHWCMLVTKILE